MQKTDPDKSIYGEYFDLTKQYQTIYGPKTLVLLQIGAFFEMYGKKDQVSCIQEICDLCQLSISDKKFQFENSAIFMAGFRDYSIEKYLQTITDNGYTVLVFVQSDTGNKKLTRILDSIHSPGTYFSYELEHPTNNILCIWMEVQKTMMYGIAVINVFTGESFIIENKVNDFIMNPTSFDEIERSISMYQPKEVIFITNLDSIDKVVQYIGVRCTIHTILLGENTANGKAAQNCMKQTYIETILGELFGKEIYSICTEFSYHAYATQAYCFLLHFIQEHNKQLLHRISLPVFQNMSSRMILANHTLKQLNIICDQNRNGVLSSVSTFLNKCGTPMGKRKLQQQITNPVFDEPWLQQEYDMISYLSGNEMIPFLRQQLSKIKDIERIGRQIISRKIYPSSIFQLHKSVEIMQQIDQCLLDPILRKYLGVSEEPFSLVLSFLETHFVLSACSCQQFHFEENIIQPGVSPELDEIISSHKTEASKLNAIHKHFNGLMHKSKNDETEYVKIYQTDKNGISLQITKTRTEILKKQDAELEGVSISWKDVHFHSASKTCNEIQFPALDSICRKITSLKQRMDVEIQKAYWKIIDKMQEIFTSLDCIIRYTSSLDVIVCKTHLANTFHYCCPKILDREKSCVNACAIRHVLIEHIQQNELYVTNDLCIGDDPDGILLYGTNAVGKTSLIRALGICIIMAQSGMFVPCSDFHYKPYRAIYSRILGNDNLFKGLSTFAVEMSELRIILKYADKNSFVLGDELCSGTETESALSIFMASLQELHEKQCSFIFATHFHEIVDYEELQELSRIHLKHLEVRYDAELDCLIYDRKLKPGSGDRNYGLEVCKSLYLSNTFLERAYAIRRKYYPENEGSLSKSGSHYNRKKIIGKCELCNKMGEEIHHLNPQKNADSTGYIGTFHKNHVANLMNICSSCHDELHAVSPLTTRTNSPVDKVDKITRKKTTKGYILV